MRLLLLNGMILLLVGSPLLVLELVKYRTEWLRRNHDWLSVIVWLATLASVYAFVLPRFGLAPNPRFFRGY
jgi:hypothetical protein